MRYTLSIAGEEKKLFPETEAAVDEEMLGRHGDVVVNHGPLIARTTERKLFQDRLYWVGGKLVGRCTAETDSTAEFRTICAGQVGLWAGAGKKGSDVG